MYQGVQLPLCLICGLYSQDIQKQRHGLHSSLKLSNGYILPEGKMTPNTLFVGGIDMKVDENEIRDFFAKYGCVKEVKIITYRGGICKGYGFVYFSEDVDIQNIVDQPICFKGKKLKLGPAIMKERNSRKILFGSMQSPMIGPSQWVSPSPYVYCSCCPPSLAPPSPVFNGGNQYMQPYSYSSLPGVMIPQVPMNYAQTTYPYQYPLPQWCGEQRTRLVNQVSASHLFSELCGLWSPNFANPSVAFTCGADSIFMGRLS
ncbi:deleted in azoospermia-like isoform X1 [Paramisgurnus dabryanus]|uniref:deleted in azoospermia-like isoform X1 n=1 Tax=Paramisgurnus dabryanus TaxID=90735 RepID=UPI0031F342EB